MCILNIIEKIKNCICFDQEYKKLIMIDITDDNNNSEITYSVVSSDTDMSSEVSSINSSNSSSRNSISEFSNISDEFVKDEFVPDEYF